MRQSQMKHVSVILAIESNRLTTGGSNMVKKNETGRKEGLEEFLNDLRTRCDGRSSRKAQICQDLRCLLHDLAKSKKLDADALRRLYEKIREYLETLYDRNISWEHVEYHTISDLRNPAFEWKPVKIRALLEKMTE